MNFVKNSNRSINVFMWLVFVLFGVIIATGGNVEIKVNSKGSGKFIGLFSPLKTDEKLPETVDFGVMIIHACDHHTEYKFENIAVPSTSSVALKKGSLVLNEITLAVIRVKAEKLTKIGYKVTSDKLTNPLPDDLGIFFKNVCGDDGCEVIKKDNKALEKLEFIIDQGSISSEKSQGSNVTFNIDVLTFKNNGENYFDKEFTSVDSSDKALISINKEFTVTTNILKDQVINDNILTISGLEIGSMEFAKSEVNKKIIKAGKDHDDFLNLIKDFDSKSAGSGSPGDDKGLNKWVIFAIILAVVFVVAVVVFIYVKQRSK